MTTNAVERIVIIGSGPAGWTAAVYAARANLEPVVYCGVPKQTPSIVLPGGQLMLTTEVENYPGFPHGVMGPEMMGMFQKQAERFGTRVAQADIERCDFTKRPFELHTDDGNGGKGIVRAHAVIIATGAVANWIGLPNEMRLATKGGGVSACAVCDGALPAFRKQPVAVVGGPAAITVALLMVPDDHAGRADDARLQPQTSGGAMDAIVRGTQDAVMLLIHITAMLIVLVALVSLANLAVAAVAPEIGGRPLSLQRMLGWLMAPLAWLVGVPWSEAPEAGALLGTKTVLNEFLAYLDLARLPPDAMGERSRLLLTYALCGFANLGSVGIMVGGLTAICPQRRADIVQLGMRSIVSGTLATCMTAAWVGVFTP